MSSPGLALGHSFSIGYRYQTLMPAGRRHAQNLRVTSTQADTKEISQTAVRILVVMGKVSSGPPPRTAPAALSASRPHAESLVAHAAHKNAALLKI